MTPFLVLARIPGLGPTEEGAMTLYVAMFPTEEEAVAAVTSLAPVGWTIEGVVGKALDSLVERRKLRPGSIERV